MWYFASITVGCPEPSWLLDPPHEGELLDGGCWLLDSGEGIPDETCKAWLYCSPCFRGTAAGNASEKEVKRGHATTSMNAACKRIEVTVNKIRRTFLIAEIAQAQASIGFDLLYHS